MRTFGTSPYLRVSRNPLVTFAIFIFVVFLGYKAAQVILADDLSTLAYAAMFFLAAR